jgi:hypothetical protein
MKIEEVKVHYAELSVILDKSIRYAFIYSTGPIPLCYMLDRADAQGLAEALLEAAARLESLSPTTDHPSNSNPGND